MLHFLAIWINIPVFVLFPLIPLGLLVECTWMLSLTLFLKHLQRVSAFFLESYVRIVRVNRDASSCSWNAVCTNLWKIQLLWCSFRVSFDNVWPCWPTQRLVLDGGRGCRTDICNTVYKEITRSKQNVEGKTFTGKEDVCIGQFNGERNWYM
jgi:hypothetical protein